VSELKTPASKALRWRLSPNHRPVRAGFVVGKGTVGQVYLEELLFHPVIYHFFKIIRTYLSSGAGRFGFDIMILVFEGLKAACT